MCLLPETLPLACLEYALALSRGTQRSWLKSPLQLRRVAQEHFQEIADMLVGQMQHPEAIKSSVSLMWYRAGIGTSQEGGRYTQPSKTISHCSCPL